MKRRLREPFGKAGLTVAILALVVAMAGGAYAASKLTKPQVKEVEKIAKKYAGKPGANGTNGSNGAAGPKGDAGAPGSPGVGTSGPNGVSVTTKAIPTSSSSCANQGGVEVLSASPTAKVCNGTTGFTQSLPSGKTEMGTWGMVVGPHVPGIPDSALLRQANFNIPLETPLLEADILVKPAGYNGTDDTGPEHEACPGTAEEPAAGQEKLCFYVDSGSGVGAAGEKKLGNGGEEVEPVPADLLRSSTKAGVTIEALVIDKIESPTNQVEFQGEGQMSFGTWAVTAP